MAKKIEKVEVDSALSKEDLNISFWESVCETNPNYTSEFRNAWGSTSTTIAPMFQIREATRKWGRLGDGWGTVVEVIALHPDVVALEVTIWNTDNPKNEKRFGNPLIGTSPLYINRKKRDSDGKFVLDSDNCVVVNKVVDDNASFKAFTTALTKGLSHYGFNSDVFLGKFDDTKYVQDLVKKHEDTLELSVECRNDFYNKINKALDKDSEYAIKVFKHFEKEKVQDFKNEELILTWERITNNRPDLIEETTNVKG